MKRLALAALAAALLLVGCSDDDSPEPKSAPTDTSSAASTPTTPAPTTSGPVEPTMPAAAEGDDAAAAEAFVEFFWDMAEYAQASGDLDGLMKLASRSCANCRAGSDYLQSVFDKGGVIEGGETDVRILESSPYEAGPMSGFEVVAQVENTRQVIDWPNRKDEVFPASSIRTRFLVERVSGQFAIGFWETLS